MKRSHKPGVLIAHILWLLPLILFSNSASAEKASAGVADKFRQLNTELPTPNSYRTAGGSPGAAYWQQRADYSIDVTLDDENHRLSGKSTIRYANNSPDSLRFLWVQLDQNRFRDDSLGRLAATSGVDELGQPQVGFWELRRHQSFADKEYGYELEKLTDSRGKPLTHTINGTMLRIDLASPLQPGKSLTFKVQWSQNIVETGAAGARGGYEYFPETDTYLHSLSQWFPRMAAYTDYASWQHKQFMGRGEFTLEFGDYDVRITAPADHIVAATGALTNPTSVLSSTQRQRLSQARNSAKPLFIVTPDEALANEAKDKQRSTDTKTWHFKADNVRDFAFASSRKFIWDAMVHNQPGAKQAQVLAMSFYPNEAEPIWSQYSTHAVVHTLEVYSRFSFDYPYPTAQSVNTWERGGMEYPMITFNGYRPKLEKEEAKPQKDGKEKPDRTYARATKASLIGVIIHEIGHFYYPMIVNSDERQWTWMDEGINSFLQHLAELEWDEEFHMFRDNPSHLDHIGAYMISEAQVPVMTNSESILQFGPNAYAKPAAALIVLRETVMGRELFDFAFKEYSNRWKFKRPTPADFFRSMEDASAVDLDWFWRGWFYSTDHVDIGINSIREYKVASMNPEIDLPAQKQLQQSQKPEPITAFRNREEKRTTRVERIKALEDYYDQHDKYKASNKDINGYQEFLKGLEHWEKVTLERAVKDDDFIYFVEFANHGGLISPLPLKITYTTGETEMLMLPAEIWRQNSDQVSKTLIRNKQIQTIELDPRHQTADVARINNYYPAKMQPSRLQLFKQPDETRNLMKDMLVELKNGESKVGGDGKAAPLTAKEAPQETANESP